MPIVLQTDRPQDLTILTASGEITFAEAMEALDSFYENPTQNVLLDVSRRADAPVILKTEDLARIFSRLSARKKNRLSGKTAIVAPDDLRFYMSRIAEAFAEIEKLPWKMKAFRSKDEAIRWLTSGE